MKKNYEEYVVRVVELKNDMLNNVLIAKEINREAVFVSEVLKYAKSKGYYFPKLTTSSNKHKRRRLVNSPSLKNSQSKTTPKTGHLRSKWRSIIYSEKKYLESDLESFKEVKAGNKSTGFFVSKTFWLFQD